MAAETTRVKDIPTTATTAAADDYVLLDGATNGTRKGLASNLITPAAAATAAAAVAGHNLSPMSHREGRPKLGIFGNSIADQSGCFLVYPTTTLSARAEAGQSVIAVVSASGITSGTKVVTRLYDSRRYLAVVDSVVGNNVTLTAPLPALVRLAEPVYVYTTKQPTGWAQGIGLASAANSLAGSPFDVMPVYGYGGASVNSVLQDLPYYLRTYRPTHCVLHLFENDVAESTTLAELQSCARSAARSCRENGCVPIICSCVPYNLISGAQVAVYDGLLDYIVNTLPSMVPGTVGVDCSTKWLDTSNPTYPRSPASGWTDGVHPVFGKLWTAAELTLAPVLRSIATTSEFAHVSPFSQTMLYGTGGTSSGLTGGSISPDGWVINIYNGKMTGLTSRNPDGSLRFVLSCVGKNISMWDDYLYAFYTFTHPVAWPAARYFRAYVKMTPVSLVDISTINISATMTEAVTFSYSPGIASEADLPAGASPVVLLSAPFQFSPGNTTCSLSLSVVPKTNAESVSEAVIDVYEVGLIECQAPLPTTVIT